MARVPFRLPDIGEGIAEAEIVAWHVAVGDKVEEDAPLADMMTDKATVELTSPVTGTVVERAGEAGDKVAIGSVLVTFETEGAAPSAEAAEPGIAPQAETAVTSSAELAPATTPSPAPAQPAHRVLASPAVRARAKTLGIDLAEVKTADCGRVRLAVLSLVDREEGGSEGLRQTYTYLPIFTAKELCQHDDQSAVESSHAAGHPLHTVTGNRRPT